MRTIWAVLVLSCLIWQVGAQEVSTCTYEGRMLVYNNEDGALVMRDVDDPDAEPILIAEEGRRAAWSPDGCTLTYYAQRTILYWDGETTTHYLPFEIIDLNRMAWSPDGNRFAFDAFWMGLSHIFVANPEGTSMQQLTDFGLNEEPPNPPGSAPSWSPDGSQLAYVGNDMDQSMGGLQSVYVIDMETGASREVAAVSGSTVLWTLDGASLIIIGGDEVAEVQRLNLESDETETIFATDASISGMGLSPDGTRLLVEKYTQEPNQPGMSTMYILSAEDGAIVWSFEGSNAVWSPDGRSIAYHRFTYPDDGSRGSTCEVFVRAGLEVPQRVDRCRVGSLAWRPVPTQ